MAMMQETQEYLTMERAKGFRIKQRLSDMGRGTHWFCSRGRHSRLFHGIPGSLQELLV